EVRGGVGPGQPLGDPDREALDHGAGRRVATDFLAQTIVRMSLTDASPAHDTGLPNPEEDARMIRTGDEYRASIRDGREVWIDGERVADVTAHPAFKPIVDAKARMYDLARDATAAPTMT